MAATRGAFATAPAAATSAQRTLLLLPPAAAAAPHQAHPAAAWGAAAPHGLPQHRAHRALLPPCRITNTSEEVYRAVGKKVPDGGIPDEIMMPEIQVHNPELGVLENRVGKFYLQELFEDSGVDLEETAYWFHTPPGGWDAKPVKMVPAPEAPVTFPEPHHAEDEEDSANRVPISQLEEGVEVVGMVTDCWLYHGIQVDFGAEYDGLVPIREECWREEGVRETLLPGAEVRVRIYKLRTPGLYRWPVQLELVDPSWINNMLPPPEAYQAPINHEWCDEQGWTVEQICEATGRGFAPNSLLMPLDHAVQMQDIEKMYAWDDPDTNLYFRSPIQDYLEEEGGEEITELVTRMQVEGF